MICAWGKDGRLLGRDRAVLTLLRELGVKPHCLGTNGDGTPKHPLYIAYDVTPVEYQPLPIDGYPRGMSDLATEGMSTEGMALTRELSPRVLPNGWTFVQGYGNVVRHIHRKLQVIVTGSRERDGRRWMHVSVIHRDRLPTWDELREVKDWLVGRDRLAVQVLPPAGEYVNVHPNCLHLWHCLDGDPVPDFRRNGQV